ncbi:receptor-interacting serine/threonine-protein kinase 1 isoform 2-T2 [Pholidichthys leucotaenia]
MATAQQSCFHMRSSDLIKKEPLDYGGFGEVYLCYHVTLGQVVLKTMYTGCLRSDESKKSLLEEGNIMASLNHERVVKLLGVIMEDRDCSLVMELLPRGNLLVMLETVSVPVSVKGRIILEILEGLVYLTEKNVLHKDIKPENILVDKDFHIKIADLGLATCQAWSKLTKQESRRKSRRGETAGVRGAGTLSYMAPEHLESIHTPSTEKSDVYSFAIVVWVILTGQEPYANARSEDQISQCVRNGDRPTEDVIPDDTLPEIIQLMRRCWDQNPQERPTFKESYDFFYPFYMEKLEPSVENDLHHLGMSYEGPGELVEKMKSLSLSHGFSAIEQDSPAPLMSSDSRLSVPVEASIEDLHDIQYDPCEEYIQSDARRHSSPSALEEKLDRELQYHKHGSYSCDNQPEVANCVYHNSSNHFQQSPVSFPDNCIRQPEEERPSSVHSWTKAEPVHPTSEDDSFCRPTGCLYESMISTTSSQSHLPMSASTPSLSVLNQRQPHSCLDRQQSWPTYPVYDTSAPDITPRCPLTPSKGSSLQDQGSLCIHNASAIQIGSNNTMNIRGFEHSVSSPSLSADSLSYSPLQERIQKYDHAVKEEHLDLLRDSIGANWKHCARRLGLSDVEIETIQHDYSRDGLPEMVHQMLERWKMKEGSIGCTIGKLCHALKGAIKADVIRKILDTCSCPSS